MSYLLDDSICENEMRAGKSQNTRYFWACKVGDLSIWIS